MLVLAALANLSFSFKEVLEAAVITEKEVRDSGQSMREEIVSFS